MNKLEQMVNRLFGVEATFRNEHEDMDLFEFVASLTYSNTFNEEVYSEISSYIVNGDKLSLIFDDDNDATDSSSVQQEKFIQVIKETLDKTPVTLTVRINKRCTNGLITVYDYDWFLKYLQGLSLKSAFSVFGKKYSEGLRKVSVKEMPITTLLSSVDFMFCSEDVADMPRQINIEEVNEKVKDMKSCCHWDDTSNDFLLPDTLMFSDSSNGKLSDLKVILDKMCFYQTIRFIYDYTTLTDDEFRYHISGYKAISGKVNCKKISQMDDVPKSLDTFYNIYKWIYNEGNIADKLGIARNIITINGKGDNLEISGSTIQAIKSNFNIYNQKNAERYIDIRNHLTNIFLELQKQINDIADGYANEFNRNITTLMTFFITVIVLKAVSKSDSPTGFNLSVSVIGLVFVIVSFFIKKHSALVYKEKILFLQEYINGLKERYSKILSEEEKEHLFSGINNMLKPSSDESFIKIPVSERVVRSNKIWSFFLMFLALSLIFILLITGLCDIMNQQSESTALIAQSKIVFSCVYMISLAFTGVYIIKK